MQPHRSRYWLNANPLDPTAFRAQAEAVPAQEPSQSAPESADDEAAVDLEAATGAHEAVGSRVVVRALLAENRNASVEAVMGRTGLKRRRAYELLRQERTALNGSSGGTQ